MAAPVKALSVFGPAGLRGTLHATDPLSFSYADSWLRRADAAPLHPAIPLSSETDASGYVAAFFENPLSEGEQRKLISSREQVSTIFGLLAKVGGESAGSVVLLPQGETLWKIAGYPRRCPPAVIPEVRQQFAEEVPTMGRDSAKKNAAIAAFFGSCNHQ